MAGSANAPRAVTLSAVFYVLRLLLPPGTPTNDGILRSVDVLTTPGSLADASYPSAVCAGNVETSQRLVDLALGALSKAPGLGARIRYVEGVLWPSEAYLRWRYPEGSGEPTSSLHAWRIQDIVASLVRR